MASNECTRVVSAARVVITETTYLTTKKQY